MLTLLALLACAPADDDTALLISEGGWVEAVAEEYEPETDSLYWRAEAPFTGPAPVQLWIEIAGAWQTSDRPVGWTDDGTVLLAYMDPEMDLGATFYVWADEE